MTSLHRHFSVECLPTIYGGKVEIPEGTGVALGDLFRLYSKEFESKNFIQKLTNSTAYFEEKYQC